MRTLLTLILFVFVSCGDSRIIHFYSMDMSQCITVIDKGESRYIINGKHKVVPLSQYVKLDMSGVDPLVCGLRICWKTERYEWDVELDNAEIMESKLDSARFNFKNTLPTDERGLPTEIKFRQDGCAVFSFYMMKLTPNKGAIVELE